MRTIHIILKISKIFITTHMNRWNKFLPESHSLISNVRKGIKTHKNPCSFNFVKTPSTVSTPWSVSKSSSFSANRNRLVADDVFVTRFAWLEQSRALSRSIVEFPRSTMFSFRQHLLGRERRSINLSCERDPPTRLGPADLRPKRRTMNRL